MGVADEPVESRRTACMPVLNRERVVVGLVRLLSREARRGGGVGEALLMEARRVMGGRA